MNANELKRRASLIDWWHGGMDLGHGVITQGTQYPAQSLLPRLGLPDDLSGKSVLDIGTWDGFIAFECERRNASRVVATDSHSWDKANGPTIKHYTGRDGFDLAHEAIGSDVIPVSCDVLDLSASDLGTFDIVLLLGVLYHTRHPLLTLERAAAMTRDLLIIETHTDMNDIGSPVMRFYPTDELNGDITNWWGPNAACVLAMLQSIGFSYIESDYSMWPRAVFRAYKKKPGVSA